MINKILNAFAHKNTLWGKASKEHIPVPQETYLKTIDIEAHLDGEYTISIQLIQPGTNMVKAGAIDIDSHSGSEGILDALKKANKIKETANNFNIPVYLEFSGRRGFHVWVFCNGVIQAHIMRRLLLFLIIISKIDDVEIFPTGDMIYVKENLSWDGTGYKPIKLPFGKHREGSWSVFIEWGCEDPTEMIPIEMERFFKELKKNKPFILEEIASLYHDPGLPKSQKAVNFSKGEKPDCIEHLIKKGVPKDILYNKANVILARYALSAGLDDKQALLFGEEMAKSTEKVKTHPTSKNFRKKNADFKGVWNCVKNHPEKYPWTCLLVFSSKLMISNEWCTGWNCPYYPHEKTDLEKPVALPADYAIERDVIQFLLHYKEQSLEYAQIEDVPSEGFISTVPLSEKSKTVVPIYQFLFDICCQLIGQGIEIREATILSIIKNEKRFNKYDPLLSELVVKIYRQLIEINPCEIETFKLELIAIHEAGNRLLARRDLASASNALNKKEGLNEALSVVETVRMSMLGRTKSLDNEPFFLKVPRFLQALRCQTKITIPTKFSLLDHKLAGGLRNRFYVIAGMPGGGKTSFALQIAINAAIHHVPVLFLPYEMSEQEIYNKIISMRTGIDSMLLEAMDLNSPKGSFLMEQVEEASRWIMENIPLFTIKECGAEDTVYKIRTHVLSWRKDAQKLNGQTPEERMLTVVDSTNHVKTGNAKIDADEVQTSSWVGAELSRMVRETDTNSAIFGLNEITKEGFTNVLRTGRLDLGSLRGAFRVVHNAHVVFVIKSGLTEKGVNQVELVYPVKQKGESEQNEKNRIIADNIYQRYPIEDWKTKTYICLDCIKNRFGQLGSILFLHDKACHRFHQIEVKESEVKTSFIEQKNKIVSQNISMSNEDVDNLF